MVVRVPVQQAIPVRRRHATEERMRRPHDLRLAFLEPQERCLERLHVLVEASGRTIARQIDQMPAPEILGEIDRLVDMQKLEDVLMAEGIKKFADPQKALLALIAAKRKELAK